jgi:flagellum-specific peptidoglycan hydrolase FlgJ
MGRDEFFSAMMPHAQRVSDRTGIDPRLVLAQAALETGYGKSAPNNNFFGIKSHGRGGGSNLQTKEFEGGRMVTKSQSFRGYSDPGESFDDYADFLLRNKRYQPVLNAGGLDAQIAAMGKSGYATDPNYASKLAQIAGAAPVGGAQPIADAAMAAIGKQPIRRESSIAIGGQGADTMDTPRQGLLGQLARPDEKVGGLLGMMFGNMSPDRADQIRANLGGLMGIDNQGMVDSARGRMAARSGARESDLNYNRQQHQVEQERAREAQRTAQAQAWIAQNAPPEIAAAVKSGVLTPQQAYAIANNKPETYTQVTGADLGYTGEEAGKLFNVSSDNKITAIGGGGTSITNNLGGGQSEFDKKTQGFMAEEAQAIATQGMQAQRNISQIDQLGTLLETAGSGAGTAFTAAASRLGLKLDGASEVEAANAIISQLVPQQRPRGSGTMSDADLALFKNSLPQLMNTPEGNKIIIDTMRNIALYDIDRGKIARQQQLGQLTQEKAIQAYEQLGNPLAGFNPPATTSAGTNDVSAIPEGVTAREWEFMSPEDRALFK